MKHKKEQKIKVDIISELCFDLKLCKCVIRDPRGRVKMKTEYQGKKIASR
jgi:hypothetical protein